MLSCSAMISLVTLMAHHGVHPPHSPPKLKPFQILPISFGSAKTNYYSMDSCLPYPKRAMSMSGLNVRMSYLGISKCTLAFALQWIVGMNGLDIPLSLFCVF
ncbi:hypothetical protein Dimus_037992 [Dionaea muscipula]